MGIKDQLHDYIGEKCLGLGIVTLSSGRQSNKYFNLKRATLTGQPLVWITQIFAGMMSEFPMEPNVIGGKSMGANLIATPLSIYAFQNGLAYSHVSIAYLDSNNRVNVDNPPQPGAMILVIDDVFTTMKSAEFAARAFDDYYAVTMGYLGIIDRRGPEDMARTRGLIVRTIFREEDF